MARKNNYNEKLGRVLLGIGVSSALAWIILSTLVSNETWTRFDYVPVKWLATLLVFVGISIIGTLVFALYHEPTIRRFIVSGFRFFVSMIFILGGTPFGFVFSGAGSADTPGRWSAEISLKEASISTVLVFAIGSLCIVTLIFLYALHGKVRRSRAV